MNASTSYSAVPQPPRAIHHTTSNHHNRLHSTSRPSFLSLAEASSSTSLARAIDADVLPSPCSLAIRSATSPMSKTFNMADVAAQALARPRSTCEPWAERDSTLNCPNSPLSSNSSTPNFSLPNSPFSDATSCPMTPSSSAGSFALPPQLKPTCAAPTAPLSPAINVTRPLPSLPVPSPAANDEWNASDFSLKLLFTNPHTQSNTRISPSATEEEISLPPAFFPSQRISFSPRIRITAAQGLPYTSLGGMHLGVTGMCEVLDPSTGKIKSKRMIADFCIDLTSGLKIWKRDAEMARNRSDASREGASKGRETLPAGTYVLPLSMKIPNSDRLPPSFESAEFRIHYTMSIAVFSAAQSSNGTPRRLKVFSIPFHVLPSTLPSLAPELPVLTHDHKKGVFASLINSISPFSPKTSNELGYHIVHPSLPTSHFSPGAAATVPVTLKIVDRPLEPTDLYIRLAIVRKTYVRESSHTNLQQAISDEWGLNSAIPPSELGYPEESLIEPWCQNSQEIVSRWGWIPYNSRPGADPMEKAEVLIKDIGLPLADLEDGTWPHAYSTNLDLEPTSVPNQTHGECSWFSPAFRNRIPVVKEYSKHVHVSCKFYVSIEIGFATPALSQTLHAIGQTSPEMEIPAANCFTQPIQSTTSPSLGHSISNPFATQSSRHHTAGGTTAASSHHAFPGKLRELLIPITIGSVAEPGMAAIQTEAETSQSRAEREAREERGEDTSHESQGAEGSWLCAPPNYAEACLQTPYNGI